VCHDLNAEFILVISANAFFSLFELYELCVCYQEMANISVQSSKYEVIIFSFLYAEIQRKVVWNFEGRQE